MGTETKLVASLALLIPARRPLPCLPPTFLILAPHPCIFVYISIYCSTILVASAEVVSLSSCITLMSLCPHFCLLEALQFSLQVRKVFAGARKWREILIFINFISSTYRYSNRRKDVLAQESLPSKTDLFFEQCFAHLLNRLLVFCPYIASLDCLILLWSWILFFPEKVV